MNGPTRAEGGALTEQDGRRWKVLVADDVAVHLDVSVDHGADCEPVGGQFGDRAPVKLAG